MGEQPEMTQEQQQLLSFNAFLNDLRGQYLDAQVSIFEDLKKDADFEKGRGRYISSQLQIYDQVVGHILSTIQGPPPNRAERRAMEKQAKKDAKREAKTLEQAKKEMIAKMEKEGNS